VYKYIKNGRDISAQIVYEKEEICY